MKAKAEVAMAADGEPPAVARAPLEAARSRILAEHEQLRHGPAGRSARNDDRAVAASDVHDRVPPAYHILPGSDRVLVQSDIDTSYDAAFIIECSDVDRPGLPGLHREFVVNIDHHSTTLPFGDINIELSRLNAIDFSKGWADGLKQLVAKLEKEL